MINNLAKLVRENGYINALNDVVNLKELSTEIEGLNAEETFKAEKALQEEEFGTYGMEGIDIAK